MGERVRHAATLLVVDDNAANVRVLNRMLAREGYRILTAPDGDAALAIFDDQTPDLVLLNVMMPKFDVFEMCRRLKSDPTRRLVPVVLITALDDRDSKIQGIDAGADDLLTRPLDGDELTARVRSLLRLKRYTDDLDSAESVILSLALTIEARDPHTHGHCQRLADYATALGRRVGCTEDDLAALHRGGYLHDLGKIAIPDAVLLKRGRLTTEEFALMKEHPVVGERLCGQMRSLRNVRDIIRHHHERLDGSGYPDGLEGDAVPLLAQIIGIVDVYDALTSDRPYRAALSMKRAYEVLRDEVARGWRRRDLVDEFVDLLVTGELSDDSVMPARTQPMTERLVHHRS